MLNHLPYLHIYLVTTEVTRQPWHQSFKNTQRQIFQDT